MSISFDKYSVTQYSVSSLLGFIEAGAIAVPEIQRPFVWRATQVRDLIDSLYNGYPTGYLIIWQNPDVKLKDGGSAVGKKVLIDGQQRVTAMMTAIAGQKILTEDYEEKVIRIAFNPLAKDNEERFAVGDLFRSAGDVHHIFPKEYLKKSGITDKSAYNQVVNYAYIEEKYLDKPAEHYTWDKLRRATGVDRRVTVREMLDKIFGLIPGFKNKQELVNDEFDGFLLTCGVPAGDYYEVRRFFETYLTDKEVRRAIDDHKFQRLGTDIPSYTFSELKRLGMQNMRRVVGYINDNVNLSRFM